MAIQYIINGEKVRKLFALCFGVLILLPIFGYITYPNQSFDVHEKREMASFPSYGGSAIGLKDQINNYINDHFGFRSQLMDVHAGIERAFIYLKLASPDLNSVLVGKNGWLFFVGDDGLDDLHRSSYLTEEQLSDLSNVIKQRVNALEPKQITYLFAVAPDKQSIYPEYLPWGSVDENKPSRLSEVTQFINRDFVLKKHYLSLVSALIAAKNSFPTDLYYKTDTHWNTRGSYFAYKAIMDSLSNASGQTMQSPSFDLSQCKIDLSFKGDLDDEAGLELSDQELSFPSEMKPEGNCRLWFPPSLLDSSHMDSENYPLCVRNPAAPYSKKILVLCDSFGGFVSAYLAQSFQEVMIYRLQPSVRNDILADLVRRHHPDYILDMRVERYLNPNEQAWVKDASNHPLHINFETTAEEKLLGRLSDASWNITSDKTNLQTNSPDSTEPSSIPIDRSAPISGSVESISQPAQGADVVRVSGWVQSPISPRPCDAVLATLDSYIIAVDQPNLPRNDAVARPDEPANCGFKMALPESVLVHPGQLHFFALYHDGSTPPLLKLREIPISAGNQNLVLTQVNVQVQGNRIVVVSQ